MPKFMLKRFENTQHFLFYLDVVNGEIRKGHAKSINTEEGYYSAAMERELSQQIEEPWANICRWVDEIDFGQSFSAREDFFRVVKAYVSSLCARDPQEQKESDDGLYIQFMLTEQQQNDYLLESLFTEACMSQFWEERDVTFIENCSKRPFVLPVCGMYVMKSFCGTLWIIVPLSPDRAIALTRKEDGPRLRKGQKMPILRIEKEAQVAEMNIGAGLAQRRKKWGYVVSGRRDELETLRMGEFERELAALRANGLKENPLRREYEKKVAALAELPQKLREKGMDEEEIARRMHGRRRELGRQYKEAAPPLFWAYINYATEKKYGGPLGPDYEALRRTKSCGEIIASTSRPIEDLDARLTIDGFQKWYEEKYKGEK